MVDAAADRPSKHGLRGAGHVFEQDMAAAHQRSDDELQLFALAIDDGLDVVEQARRDVDGAGKALLYLLGSVVSAPNLHRLHGADPSRTGGKEC
jgi:hypothetical protein